MGNAAAAAGPSKTTPRTLTPPLSPMHSEGESGARSPPKGVKKKKKVFFFHKVEEVQIRNGLLIWCLKSAVVLYTVTEEVEAGEERSLIGKGPSSSSVCCLCPLPLVFFPFRLLLACKGDFIVTRRRRQKVLLVFVSAMKVANAFRKQRKKNQGFKDDVRSANERVTTA